MPKKQLNTDIAFQEEERLFFSNVIIIITVLISLVIALSILSPNPALNGSTPLSPNQVLLTYLEARTLVIYISTVLFALFIASLLRFMSSWNWKVKLLRKFSLKSIAWIILLLILLWAIQLVWFYVSVS